MEIFKIAIVGIVAGISALVIREHRSDIALLVGIAGGIIILLSLVEYIGITFGFLSEIATLANMDKALLKTLLKIVVIGYIADFSAGIVEDSGAKSLSEKIILGGKLLIFVVSIPIIRLLLSVITEMLQ